MGYTNYWTMNKAEEDEFSTELQDKIRHLVKVAKESGIKVKLVTCSNTVINVHDGEKDEYENLLVRADKKEMSCFCKTARHGYDAVVKCILMLLEAEDFIERWHFDGNMLEKEFQDAIDLARKAGIC